MTDNEHQYREKLAAWMIENSFATGHGDSFDDLLTEMGWQIQELLQLLEAKRNHIFELEDRLFALGAMENAPCFCCGYNGPGYYQPSKHPCAERHHRLWNPKSPYILFLG